MTYFQEEKQKKGEEREGGMPYHRITTVPHYLYKPLLLRVRESAVYSLLSPTTQTLFHHRISSVQFVPLTWSDLYFNPQKYSQSRWAKPTRVRSWPRAPFFVRTWRQRRSGPPSKAKRPARWLRSSQPPSPKMEKFQGILCGNDSLKMWKWCRRNDAETAEEMMQKQGEEKKCQ